MPADQRLGLGRAGKEGTTSTGGRAEAGRTAAADSKRFHMTQNGKQMTADDFEAWMKKSGYRVATGAPAKAKVEEPAKQGSK